MISKKHLTTLICITSFGILTACASKGNGAPPESALNQICVNLKQQIIMDQVANVPEQLGSNPAKEAGLYKSYDQYNCDEVLGHVQNTNIFSRFFSKKHKTTSNG